MTYTEFKQTISDLEYHDMRLMFDACRWVTTVVDKRSSYYNFYIQPKNAANEVIVMMMTEQMGIRRIKAINAYYINMSHTTVYIYNTVNLLSHMINYFME